MIAGILAGSINKDLQLCDYDDCGSSQSEGMPLYANKWRRLLKTGFSVDDKRIRFLDMNIAGWY